MKDVGNRLAAHIYYRSMELEEAALLKETLTKTGKDLADII